jgi:transposase-like protein
MVRDHGSEYPSQRAAIALVAAKLGCDAKMLRDWVRQTERDAAERTYLTAYERIRLKTLERENRELRRTNEVLRKTTALFAYAALERRTKGV